MNETYRGPPGSAHAGRSLGQGPSGWAGAQASWGRRGGRGHPGCGGSERLLTNGQYVRHCPSGSGGGQETKFTDGGGGFSCWLDPVQGGGGREHPSPPKGGRSQNEGGLALREAPPSRKNRPKNAIFFAPPGAILLKLGGNQHKAPEGEKSPFASPGPPWSVRIPNGRRRGVRAHQKPGHPAWVVRRNGRDGPPTHRPSPAPPGPTQPRPAGPGRYFCTSRILALRCAVRSMRPLGEYRRPMRSLAVMGLMREWSDCGGSGGGGAGWRRLW